MTNKLKIDWDKLKTFTLIPLEVSSICKYNGKKLSADHKNIYSYFHKLQHDGKLNDTGYASFDSLMKRFGIGSKGSLTGFINHLVDIGLLVRHKEGNGTRNRYEVKDIDLELATYPSKSHVAGSNKNKFSSNNLQDKKANNYLLAKKYRAILKGDKLKAFNQWIWKADQEGVQLTAQDYATWSKNYADTEKRKSHFEDMTPCDGTENYAVLVPNSEDFDLTPAPDNYSDSSEANYGFMNDISLDGCPTFSKSEQELASYEQYLFIDEDTAEREEDITNLFTNSYDGKPEPVKHMAPAEEAEVITEIVETLTEVTAPLGDKSKLVGLIGNVDVSDINLDGKGIGYFAAPLAKGELNRTDTQQYLTVIHTHFWDDYSPDQTTVESICKKLLCEVCGDKLDDLGYCLNRDCPEHESVIPF
ncbi:hypothetical protein P7M37_20125 [Vibrio parahaemolyticus]|uniref:hypothetical protein n=1 Tax=Vibrio sp. Vb2135 TaxID=3074653 RepID=UPI0029648CBF|nr:hypothetical protein [Vibrio sp. Vb2135]EJA7359175.1 hypothetical protein [Vibrio alginolyticus]MDG2594107.1 hypothetical protein [Vibrio parahaemolyticus]MDW1761031.1 hypothetical protein [Vibrio sp. Vb2135]HCH6002157.1 hypothetical protein [Vibrio parahaemolyticus]